MQKNLLGQKDTVPQYQNMAKNPLSYIIDILNENDIYPGDTIIMIQELDKINNFWSHLFPNSNAKTYNELSEYEKKCFDDLVSDALYIHDIKEFEFDYAYFDVLLDFNYIICNKDDYQKMEKWAMDIHNATEELKYSIRKYVEVRELIASRKELI